jgi:hypothetical protein
LVFGLLKTIFAVLALTTLLLLVVAEVGKEFQETAKEAVVEQVDFALRLLQLVVEVL